MPRKQSVEKVAARHVHKYRRKYLGSKGYTVYACAHPRCLHYVRRELAEGKESICWRCGDKFFLTKKDLKLAKPHCKKCTKVTGFALRNKTAGDVRATAADSILKETSERVQPSSSIDFDDLLPSVPKP